ncbi:MAG: zinc ribbon domain-containing protein [Theionarchaea archaeon]|nr:zinc ribbon domain-containing protein [Theionarchaea archaeon]
MFDLDHRSKTQSFVILFALIISLLAPLTLTIASPGLILQIPQPTVAPNQPVYIEYYTSLGEDGTIQLDITKPPLLAIFWQSGPMPITGGLLNSITAPGFNDPGTYVVSASVNLSGLGGPLYANATFEVVTGAPPGQPGQPGQPGFDFNLEVSPPVQEIERGDPAHYEIIVQYSNPVFAGTVINLQITGLGPGMQWHSTPTGQLTISTSDETPPGTYMINIEGEAQGIVRQTVATLIVRERPEEPPPEPPPEQPPEEPPPEQPPEEPPPEQPPEEPPPEQPPEEPPPEFGPQAPEYPEYPPDQGYVREDKPESGLAALLANPLYIIVFLLIIVIIVLVVVLRKPTQQRPPSSRYCAKCGAPIKPGDSFCGSCGERV